MLGHIPQVAVGKGGHVGGLLCLSAFRARVASLSHGAEHVLCRVARLGKGDLSEGADPRLALDPISRPIRDHEDAPAGRCDLAQQPLLLGVPKLDRPHRQWMVLDELVCEFDRWHRRLS
jgi:hypothetical protein